MKYNRILAFCASALMVLAAGCDKYDDSQLWDDVDKAYNELTKIKPMVEAVSQQVELVSAVISGGAITNIQELEDGGFIISYKDASNNVTDVTIASKDEVTTDDVFGTKEENGVLYWTKNGEFFTDLDGAKVPVAGRVPSFDVNKDGYWTVNGAVMTDSKGQPIKAEGKEVSVITKVEKTADGKGKLTLGDGSEIVVEFFDAFCISVFDGTTELLKQHLITMPAARKMTLTYTLTGPSADETIVKITRQNALTAVLDATGKTISVTFPAGFEEGSFTLLIADAAGNVLIRPIYIGDRAMIPDYYGIKTAEDLQKFATAVNAGASLKRFRDGSGDIILLNDINMSGVTSWTPIGTESKPWKDSFNGKGFTVKGINFSTDVTSQTYTGLFGVVDGGSVTNLKVGQDGDKWTITGTANAGTAIAPVVAFAKGGAQITACTNNVDIDFKATNNHEALLMLSGIVARSTGATIGATGAACVNNGDIVITEILNKKNQLNGVNMGGICGHAEIDKATNITACVNNGHMACPTGRGGGICGSFLNGKMSACTNNGLVEDGTQYMSDTKGYDYKRMGGLAGATDAAAVIDGCTNLGTVITHVSCRTGGFVGHNAKGTVQNCTNGDKSDLSKGNIVGDIIKDASGNQHGPGWACGYTSSAIKTSYGYGRVATYAQKDNLDAADIALHDNAVAHGTSYYKYVSGSTPTNWVNWESTKYCNWEVTSTKSLHAGVKYMTIEWTRGISRNMKVIEVDLTNSGVELTAVMADGISPNPNGNNNSNNGKNKRETLSEVCTRLKSTGIVAGVNAGFFDSHDGIPRGIHVEEGIPMYVNNRTVRWNLTNHKWGFTQFTDKTASCGVKEFTGKYKVAGTEYEYYAINDTICRHGSDALMSNVYTYHYKKTPHSGLSNPLSKKCLYVLAQFTGDYLHVNTGYHKAKVTKILDGRSSSISTDNLPYISDKKTIGIQIRGTVADAVKATVKVGDEIEIKCDITIDGTHNKPIYSLNSSMYQFLLNGKVTLTGLGSDNANLIKYDPVTFVGCDEAGTKVWIVQVDGRDESSLGMTAPEMAATIKKLGGHNMTRFDGGGSSAMWANGKLVSEPSDSKGERSCMNYLLVRAK